MLNAEYWTQNRMFATGLHYIESKLKGGSSKSLYDHNLGNCDSLKYRITLVLSKI